MPNTVNPIVVVQVSQTLAPIANNLQQLGAFVSTGGSSYPAGSLSPVITQFQDALPYIIQPATITSMVLATGTVTVTTAAPHNIPVGMITHVVISGVVPLAYNGNVVTTSLTSTTFSYPLAGTPGAVTTQGKWQPNAAVELTAMLTTFYSQGYPIQSYVLELGPASTDPTTSTAITLLTAWLTANPTTMYDLLVPRYFDLITPAYKNLVKLYESPDALQYFWTPTTTSTYTQYTTPIPIKSVFGMVEAPSVIAQIAVDGSPTEFSLAAEFYQALVNKPSDSNKVAPFAFRFQFGVTPYPTVGNASILTTLAQAGINYISTGMEGGIADATCYPGTTADTRDFLYWYATDWTNINLNLDISNEIINGSNNPINPLYIDQNGINRLEGRAAATLSRGVTYGLLNGIVVQAELDSATFDQNLNNGVYAGKAVINAIPFLTYYTDNPSDYATGTYNGMAAVVVPSRGFLHILFNLNITDFVTQ